jgi:hypothetical protein
MKTYSLILFTFFAFLFNTLNAQTYTAEQLYKERRSNSQAFENKYFNKTITLSGKIWALTPSSVELPGFKNYHQIALTGTGYETFIICQIPFDQKEVLNQFKTGQRITVTGIYNEKSLNYVLLNNCSFSGVADEKVKKKANPAQIPLGQYSVYQQSGSGFAYQYQFNLKSYTSYMMNGKSGSVRYDKKSNTIRFTSGLLKGFTGMYRATNPNNENDLPTIVLNPKGAVPDLDQITAGYQYAYYKNEK